MKSFEKISFNIDLFVKEMQEFKNLLGSSPELSERQLLRLFQTHQQLCAWLGITLNSKMIPNLIAHEYDLFGDFTCDFVIGDSQQQTFCFVEFEDAKPTSIFKKKKTRANSEWSSRFEHGFSQLGDWFHKLHDVEKSDDFEKRFGARSISFTGALVIGRSSYLTDDERLRLKWRDKFVLINSQRIRCLTFDDLLEEMERWLRTFSVAIKMEHDL